MISLYPSFLPCAIVIIVNLSFKTRSGLPESTVYRLVLCASNTPLYRFLALLFCQEVRTGVQCSLDLPFFKGVEKMIDECGKTVNPKNHFFNRKSRTLSFASWQNFA
jgi:hypothetical protein